MIDYTRDDVIEALEYLLSPVCTETQFDYCDEIRAAIAFLKEQEPRVMTFEELYVDSDESVICYIEIRDKDAINVTAPFRYPGDNLIQIPYIGTDYHNWVELKQYGKTWRCWTARPSEKTRNEVPWDE